ncbi:MAG: hypothetical protein GY755_24270 [Chloroflexi bacterium]|nr:hypothetical protein [Chloroflexota bacterium]
MTKIRQNSPKKRVWSTPTQSKSTPIDFRNNMRPFPHHPDLKPTILYRNLAFSSRSLITLGQKGPKMAKNGQKRQKSAKTRPKNVSGRLQPGPNRLQLTLETTWDHYRTILTSNRPSSTEIWGSPAGTLPKMGQKGPKMAKNGQK